MRCPQCQFEVGDSSVLGRHFDTDHPRIASKNERVRIKTTAIAKGPIQWGDPDPPSSTAEPASEPAPPNGTLPLSEASTSAPSFAITSILAETDSTLR